jgi:hypothetical protein
MKQRHFQIELVNSPCCYNSVGAAKVRGVALPPSQHISNSSQDGGDK